MAKYTIKQNINDKFSRSQWVDKLLIQQIFWTPVCRQCWRHRSARVEKTAQSLPPHAGPYWKGLHIVLSWTVSPTSIRGSLNPGSCERDLQGKQDLCRCNRDKVRPHWSRGGPDTMAGVLRRGKLGHRHTEGRISCEGVQADGHYRQWEEQVEFVKGSRGCRPRSWRPGWFRVRRETENQAQRDQFFPQGICWIQNYVCRRPRIKAEGLWKAEGIFFFLLPCGPEETKLEFRMLRDEGSESKPGSELNILKATF